jgi:hypothetical protein
MSFNKIKYDTCETEKRYGESRGPGLYMLATPKFCNPCYQTNPEIRIQKAGDSMQSNTPMRYYAGPVNVESDLKGLNNGLDDCNKYNPKVEGCECDDQGYPSGAGVVDGCKSNSQTIPKGGRCNDYADNRLNYSMCYLPTEDVRLSNPASNLRGIGINRFNPLCLDPQDQVFFPGSYMTPTRLVFRDNHRPCVRNPAVNSMNPQDPKPLPCFELAPGICANYRAPLYQFDKCG